MLLNYQELVQTLSSGNINDITKIVVDLRERIEVLHTSEYNEFLQRLYPVLHSIMTQRTKPQFVENEENKCRHAILDLLYRFPHNEVLKPIVDNFLNMIMPVCTLPSTPAPLCFRVLTLVGVPPGVRG